MYATSRFHLLCSAVRPLRFACNCRVRAGPSEPDSKYCVAGRRAGPDQPSPYLESLRAGLRELGWVEGRNLKIGTFWATGLDDMAGATQQALASDPEVVVTQEFMAIAMLLSKAPKPVVFGFSGDPVDAKLAQSWARPGGNFTGMSYLAIELVGKRVELLKEWLPDTKRIAVLARPQHPGVHIERARDRGGREEARDGAVVFSISDAVVSSGGAAADGRRGRSRQDLPRDRRRSLRRAGRFPGFRDVRRQRARGRTSRAMPSCRRCPAGIPSRRRDC